MQRWRLGGCALAVLMAAAAPVQAQQQEQEREQETEGLRVATFGALSVALDSNPQKSSREVTGDLAGIVAPGFLVQAWRDSMSLEISGRAEIARYAVDSRNNYFDGDVSGEWRVAPTDWLSLRLTGGLKRDHERLDLDIPVVSLVAQEPIVRLRARVGGELRVHLDDWDVGGGADYEDVNYLDGENDHGIEIDYDYRDYHRLAPYIRLGRRFGDGGEAYVLARLDQRDYWYWFGPDNRHGRSSEGVAGLAGLRWRNQTLALDMALGAQHQDYQDTYLPDITTAIGRAAVTWQPGLDLRLRLAVERSIAETDRFATSGEVKSRARLNGRWQFADAWSLEGQAGLQHSTPHSDQNPGDSAVEYELGLGITHHFDDRVSLGLAYAHGWGTRLADSATGADAAYDQDVLMLRLRLSLAGDAMAGAP